MQTPDSKPVKVGYRYGLILLACGLIIVVINLVFITSNYYLPKLLVAGIASTLRAPIFLIFPGGTLDRMPETKDMGKVLFRNAPVLHKVMWIVWGIISVAIAVCALIAFDPHFYK